MKQSQKLNLETRQRLAVMGRLRMADWIEMPEREFAREIEKLEKDPLFQKLYFGSQQLPGALRRQRWPGGQLSRSFFELNERSAAGGERVAVEQLAEDRQTAVTAIQRMGQPDFERYFIHAEEPLTLEQISQRTKLGVEQVRAIHELVVELGARAEFEMPSTAPPAAAARPATCLARVVLVDGEPRFEFFAPYWARGLYVIRYDLLDRWKSAALDAGERRRLPALVKRLETVNLRQSTLFRILETSAKLQSSYLASGKNIDLKPISLRQLARRLDLAPSTISRAVAHRSLQMPWEGEEPLIGLLPGRRKVLREILALWLTEGKAVTDASLRERLKAERGISVSRRTVNAVRHEVQPSK